MADRIEKSALECIVEHLQRHGVEFIVIGGQAELLYGSPRVTYDVDLCYERTRDNLHRLAEALKALNPTLRGAPPDLPFRIDAESLALGENFTFRTDLGDLDLIGYVEPIGNYSDLTKEIQVMTVGDLEISIIGLDHLIKVKRHLGRSKDRESLIQLEAVKRLMRDMSDD